MAHRGQCSLLPPRRQFPLPHDEIQQLVQVVYGTDEPIYLISRMDLEVEEGNVSILLTAACHE